MKTFPLFMLVVLANFSARIIGPAEAGPVPRFEPRLMLQPETFVIPGRSIDVLGISPGTTFSDAKVLLSKALPNAAVNAPLAGIQINYRGVVVQTSEFVSQLTFTRPASETGIDEYIVAAFSGPASGNQNVGLRRIINYKNPLSAPSIAELKKNLLDKYGSPSRLFDINGGLAINWSYAKGTLLDCKFSTNCLLESSDYQSSVISRYASAQYAADFIMEVQVTPAATDQSKVAMFSINYVAYGKRREVAKVDLDSLIGEASRLYAQTPAPAAPSL